MSTRIIYIQYIKPWSILMVDISLYYFFYIFLYVQVSILLEYLIIKDLEYLNEYEKIYARRTYDHRASVQNPSAEKVFFFCRLLLQTQDMYGGETRLSSLVLYPSFYCCCCASFFFFKYNLHTKSLPSV